MGDLRKYRTPPGSLPPVTFFVPTAVLWDGTAEGIPAFQPASKPLPLRFGGLIIARYVLSCVVVSSYSMSHHHSAHKRSAFNKNNPGSLTPGPTDVASRWAVCSKKFVKKSKAEGTVQ